MNDIDRLERADPAQEMQNEIERLRAELLVYGNIMGRIAVNLFGKQNNVTDEDCVAETAAIGYRIAGLYQRLEQVQKERNAANVELKVWQDRYQKLLECIAQAKAFEPLPPIVVVEAGSQMVGVLRGTKDASD